MRFDLSSLPASATVQSASLTLYVTSRSNSNSLTAAVYPVLRSWHAGYATWASADGSVAWTAAGCNGVGTDRSGTATASVTFAVASGSVTSPDLTALVQGWVASACAYDAENRLTGSFSVKLYRGEILPIRVLDTPAPPPLYCSRHRVTGPDGA